MSTITVFNALTGEATQVEGNDAEQAHGVDASGASLGVVPLGDAFARTPAPPGPGAGWLWSFELQAWHFTPSLTEAIDAALVAIDAAAGAARLRYITDVPGQAATYVLKLAQAKAYLDGGPVQPFVQGEAEAMGVTATQAAQFIVATAAGWEQLAPLIEGARRAGKLAASGAQNLAGVAEAQAEAVGALSAI
ncbi:MAG: hypothetical protein ABL916_22960 [Burkholderiaceae bacterium]